MEARCHHWIPLCLFSVRISMPQTQCSEYSFQCLERFSEPNDNIKRVKCNSFRDCKNEMNDTFLYITPDLQNLHQWSLPQWASGCHSPKVHLRQHCQWNQDHPDVLQTAPRGGVSRCWLYTGIQILALPFIFAPSIPLSVDDFKTGQIFLFYILEQSHKPKTKKNSLMV